MVFCDIVDFDDLVGILAFDELLALLDQTYNAFDSLCDTHGLQKIETVGKTYMACGGLKVSEQKFDHRLLQNHHSVRVVDFAFDLVSYVSQQMIKNGDALKVKIGIHTGSVVSGVVGEVKP